MPSSWNAVLSKIRILGVLVQHWELVRPDSIKGRPGTSQRPERLLLLRPDNGPAVNREAGRKLILPLSTLLGVSGQPSHPRFLLA